MRDQLITALVHTGAFSVMRSTETGVTDSNAPAAHYLIEGAVTEYEPSQASVAGGYGWGITNPRPRISDPTVSPGSVFSQVLAPNAIGGLFKQDHIAMNIHLVDLKTNVIVDSATIEAAPRDLGAALNLLPGGNSVVDFGGQMQTPMQKAIRACMVKAAVWAANTVEGQG